MNLNFFSNRAFLFFLFLFSFSFSNFLGAEEVARKEIQKEVFNIPFRLGDRMVVKGLLSQIRIIENQKIPASQDTSNLKLTVRFKKTSSFSSGLFSNPDFLIQREGSTIYFTHSPKIHKKILSNQKPQIKKKPFLEIQIEGPAIPLEVYMYQSNVKVFSWSQDLKLVQISGKVQAENTKGKMTIYVQRGKVNVKEHHGTLEVNGYALNLSFEKVKGKLKIENFLGPITKITALTGSIDMSSYKGTAELSFIRGSVHFNHEDSSLIINDLRGDLKGKSRKGNVKATLRKRAMVSIETNEGHVQIRALNSGASVRLSSLEGYIVAPKYLRKTRFYGQYRSGRLRGAHPGRITIKSQKGNIRLR